MEGRRADVLRAAHRAGHAAGRVQDGVGDLAAELSGAIDLDRRDRDARHGRSARGALSRPSSAVLFLTFLDTTIVSVTLGNIQSDLRAGVIALQWVVNAYSLVFASLMLIAGSLGDRFGRKWVMVARHRGLLRRVGAVRAGPERRHGDRRSRGDGRRRGRIRTGHAVGDPPPLPRPRGQRARALGAWAAVSGLALALGPVIGGLLVGAGDWRTVFWFNLALGAVLLVAAAALRPEQRGPAARAGWTSAASCSVPARSAA